MQYIFKSLASSSSGNCYYLGTRERGILLDAGIGVRTIRHALRDEGLNLHQVMAVVVTHDHADHIRGVGILGTRFHLPIYSTREVHAGMDVNYGLSPKLTEDCRRYVEVGKPFTLAGMTLTAFHVSHDSHDCNGYYVQLGEDGPSFLLATDVGRVDDVLRGYIRRANYLVIEANYNREMLLNGPYPEYLQRRILSDTGHMDNDVCGRTLAECYHPSMKHVWLCHLSEDNNDPQVARDTVLRHLQVVGVTNLLVEPLPRVEAIPMVELN